MSRSSLAAVAASLRPPSRRRPLEVAGRHPACGSAPRSTGAVRRRRRAALAIVTRHFNTITPENLLKWEDVHPEPTRYDFEPADRYVEFGERTGCSSSATRWCGTSRRRPGCSPARRRQGRSRDAAGAHARAHPSRRRPLQRPHPRLGRRQRGARRGRHAAPDAVARGDRRGLHRQGVRVRARGRPRRGAVLQRLQPVEAGEARRRRSRLVHRLRGKGLRVDGIGEQGALGHRRAAARGDRRHARAPSRRAPASR